MNNIMGKEIETFIEKLDELCNKAFDEADKHRVAGRDNGLAFESLGRLISCLMGVKTILFSLNHAGATNNFALKYISALPERFPRKDIKVAERYLKETHMAIRFVLFQNFYSQTEFTFRIIQRIKHQEDYKRNPFKLIAEKYQVMKDNIPEFLNDIRNTIHNNGHYFPSDNLDKEYTVLGKKYRFEQGEPINEVTMTDIIDIIDYLLNEIIMLFRNNEEIALIEFN